MALLNTFPLDARSGNAYGFEWLRYMLDAVGLQEGVLAAGDLKITAAAAGGQRVDVAAGTAVVRGDSGVRNGLYIQVNDATIANVTLTASNGTNPRLDQIILTVNDSTDLASGSDTPAISVLTGTATAGATLDNRTGAAALPNNAIRLADVLVPAGSAAVTAGNVRDRRPWARGAYWRGQRATNATTTNAVTPQQLDTAAFQARIECTGNPVDLWLQGAFNHSVAGGAMEVRYQIDGAVVASTLLYSPATNYTHPVQQRRVHTVPAAGSRLIEVLFTVAVSAGTVTISTDPPAPSGLVIEEQVRGAGAANT